MAKYSLTVNTKKYTVEADPDTPLLWVIRDYVGLKGTKFGCGMALCGACTVHLDGQPTRACQTPVSTVKNQKITTIEGRPPRTASLDRRASTPVWLLPVGPNHGRRRPDPRQQKPNRR
jgi:isoquinoline 1-oxidoreductase subunit alpha